jgi:hypothetical protein
MFMGKVYMGSQQSVNARFVTASSQVQWYNDEGIPWDEDGKGESAAGGR